MNMLPTGKWITRNNQSERSLSLRYVRTGSLHISCLRSKNAKSPGDFPEFALVDFQLKSLQFSGYISHILLQRKHQADKFI